MAIDSTRLLELTKIVLSTPQGLFAALVALSSTVALIYLFLTKTTQPSGKSSSKSRSSSAKSSPAKQTSASTKKSSPKKTTNSSPKRETPSKASATKASSAKGSVADKKSSNDKKATASSKTTTSSKSRQSNGVSKSSQNKDDGEWITVSSKKKALRTKKTDEAPSAPQTRMSTRRSNQNSQTPKRI